MRATGLSDVDGSHRNMVKSSEPDASRSGRPPSAASYLETHPWSHLSGHVMHSFPHAMGAGGVIAISTTNCTHTHLIPTLGRVEPCHAISTWGNC